MINRLWTPSLLVTAALALPLAATAQVAGSQVVGVDVAIQTQVANGWSVKKAILDHDVYNDESDPKVVGEVDDVIITPEGAVSYAIVNASKYLGLSSHNVLIPVEQFKIVDNRITLPGATKEALRDLPEFEYADHEKKSLK